MAASSWSGQGTASGSGAIPPPSPSLGDRSRLKGGTILTVLGGLLPQDPTGVHLLEFPAYVPPTTQNAVSASGNISAPLRAALKDSITPVVHNMYPTDSTPEDFLLLPRNSPHYGMAYDPSSIIITTGVDSTLPVLASAQATRGIEAWTFPPTSTNPPKRLRLPSALNWSGAGTCTTIEMVTLSTLAYRRLLHQYGVGDPSADRIPLLGGRATPKPRPRMGHGATDNSLRILVTTHVDLSVKFWDCSTHLLTPTSGDGTVAQEFPKLLTGLTMDMRGTLREPQAAALEASRILKERSWEVEIKKVSLAKESLEVAVLFTTGDLIVSRSVSSRCVIENRG
jgi:syntaxin-binding protein 5